MKPKRKNHTRPKLETYRVWVEQVNQTYLDVKATSHEDAHEKGYRAWRRGYAHSRVSDVQKEPDCGFVR